VSGAVGHAVPPCQFLVGRQNVTCPKHTAPDGSANVASDQHVWTIGCRFVIEGWIVTTGLTAVRRGGGPRRHAAGEDRRRSLIRFGEPGRIDPKGGRTAATVT